MHWRRGWEKAAWGGGGGRPRGRAHRAARLETAGVALRREIAAVADQRCAAEVISFRDPAGNRVEAFHGGQIADEPFRPGRHIGGFRTGTQGVGHAVLIMPDIDAALTFYRDLLGFRITDFMGPP